MSFFYLFFIVQLQPSNLCVGFNEIRSIGIYSAPYIQTRPRHCLLPIHLHHLNEIKMEEKNNLSKCANHRQRRKKALFDISKRGYVDCFSYRKFSIKHPNAASTFRLFPKVRATIAAKVYCIKILLLFITTLLNMQYGSKTTRYLLSEQSNHSSI